MDTAEGDGPVSKRAPKGKSRKQGAGRTTTLMTRSPTDGTDASGELETLLSKSWERMFPGVGKPEELSTFQRKDWIRHQEVLIRTFYELADAAKTIGDGFLELVEADARLTDAKIADLSERRGVGLEIEKKDSQAERRERRAEREGKESREDQLLAQAIAERRRFMFLGTISFLFTLLLVLVGVVTEQSVSYAGSGAGLLVSFGLWGLGIFRPMQKQRRREEDEDAKRRKQKQKK